MRDAILNNFWWKMTALLLAVLAWYGFQPRENRPNLLPTTLRPYFTRHLIAHPVTISKQATDHRDFRVFPSEVDLTLSGDEKVLRALADREIRATVYVSDLTGETNSVEIQLALPPEKGIKIETISPEKVRVELVKN